MRGEGRSFMEKYMENFFFSKNLFYNSSRKSFFMDLNLKNTVKNITLQDHKKIVSTFQLFLFNCRKKKRNLFMYKEFFYIQLVRAERFYTRILNDIYGESLMLDAQFGHSKDSIPFSQREKLKYKPIREGEIWGTTWENAWFHFQGEVPKSWKGKEVVLLLQLSGEALLFDEKGSPKCGFSGGSVFSPSYQKNRFTLFKKAKGGENVDLWVESCASFLLGAGVDRDPDLNKPFTGGTVTATAQKMRLAVFRRSVWELFMDVSCLCGVARHLPETDYRRNKIIFTLDKALSLYHDDPENAEKCREALKEVLELPAVKSSLQVYAVGHAHIDVAWLWQAKESIRKAARTFSSQLRLMEEFPKYVFGASQPQLYAFVKEHYPSLFDEIRKRVKEGRWELQGGMWVEADCNLISGESMVRQFLHGKNFFKDEFGVEVKNLWLPDVFGYSGAMPQIIRKAGCDFFLTQKLSWSQINTFPHNTFIWKGIDGTEIPTHFPPENTYNSFLRPELLMTAQERFKENGFLDKFLSLYGIGDGGGGPSDEHVNMGMRSGNWEFTPRVKFASADEFFHELEKDIPKLEKWTGELYLEFHRGTLTSQARTKRGNRKCEEMLSSVEFLLAHLPLKEYPQKALDRYWKLLLLNQFHDILPGSSIHAVYERTEKEHKEILAGCRTLLEENKDKLFRKEKDSLLLVNTLSTPYKRMVQLPESWLDHSVTDEEGKEVLIQKEKDKVFASLSLSGSSFTQLHKGKKKKYQDSALPAAAKKGKSFILENDLILYEFSPDGLLVRAYDKEVGKEILAGCGNLLSLYHDRPNNYEAWDVDVYYLHEKVTEWKAEKVQLSAKGPLRTLLEIQYRNENSTLLQKVILEHNSKRLDFVTEAEWQEVRKMLRVSFPVDIESNEALYDIQYGSIKRPTHDNTSWDAAKFEACGQKYGDLSESDYGVALLNDCKYGYRIKGNTLDLALLRSPKSPDFEADRGKHFFTYSFYPHTGNCNESNCQEESFALNREPLAFEGYAKKKALQPFCRMEAENGGITLDVLKKAEKEEAYVVRLAERKGRHSQGELVFASSKWDVRESCLMEWTKGKSSPLQKNTLKVTLSPFEIRTYIIRKKEK